MFTNTLDYIICTLEILLTYYLIYLPVSNRIHLKNGMMLVTAFVFFGFIQLFVPYFAVSIFSIALSYVCGWCVMNVPRREYTSNFFMTYCSLLLTSEVLTFVVHKTIIADNDNMTKTIISGIVTVAVLLIMLIPRKKLERNAFCFNDTNRIPLLLIMVLLLCLESSFTFLADASEGSGMEYPSVVLFAVGELVILGMVFVLLYNANKRQQLSSEAQLLEEYAVAQRKYFDTLIQREEDTRRFRHDLGADFARLYRIAETEESDAMRHCLEEINNELKRISKRPYRVENETAEIILQMCLAGHEGYSKVTGYLGPLKSLKDRDLAIILYNTINNAVEAQECVGLKSRRIQIKFERGQQRIRIIIENACILESTCEKGNTSKLDKNQHGYGRISVEQTVRKNEGEITEAVHNGIYRVQIDLKV